MMELCRIKSSRCVVFGGGCIVGSDVFESQWCSSWRALLVQVVIVRPAHVYHATRRAGPEDTLREGVCGYSSGQDRATMIALNLSTQPVKTSYPVGNDVCAYETIFVSLNAIGNAPSCCNRDDSEKEARSLPQAPPMASCISLNMYAPGLYT